MEQRLFDEGLFEKLSGRYSDGAPLTSIPAEKRKLKSIDDYLSRLLNTRRESLTHMPDYGLPDVAEVFRNLPGSLKEFENTVAATIEKYEPRLEMVRVKHLPVNPLAAKISLEIQAAVKGGGKIMFRTTFHSSGQAQVNS